jgi:hypothetical protein
MVRVRECFPLVATAGCFYDRGVLGVRCTGQGWRAGGAACTASEEVGRSATSASIAPAWIKFTCVTIQGQMRKT